jgi:hypothetical protein
MFESSIFPTKSCFQDRTEAMSGISISILYFFQIQVSIIYFTFFPGTVHDLQGQYYNNFPSS